MWWACKPRPYDKWVNDKWMSAKDVITNGYGKHVRREKRMAEHRNRLQTAQKPVRSASTEEPVTYSIVAPVFNEEETLPHFYERVIAIMESLQDPFELLFVNDGSRDGSFRIMQELHAKDPRVHV